jgi:hypothetical protein
MKCFIRESAATVLALLGYMLSIGAFAAAPDPGSIQFYYDDTPICTLPIEAGVVNFHKKQKDCKLTPNRPTSFQLNNVRSGAFITISMFRDANPDPNNPNYGCHNYGNYRVVLKTIQDKLSLPRLQVYDMQKYDTGKPVVPGLLLLDKVFYYPQYLAGIGCVRIEFR